MRAAELEAHLAFGADWWLVVDVAYLRPPVAETVPANDDQREGEYPW